MDFSVPEARFHSFNMRCIIAENHLADLSLDFSVKFFSFTETIKGHYSLVNKLERSVTSIGANIREAKYAHGRADFIAKLQIALKECFETEYCPEIIQRAVLSKNESTTNIIHDCG